jgi:hypothetical protein
MRSIPLPSEELRVRFPDVENVDNKEYDSNKVGLFESFYRITKIASSIK